MLHDRSRQIALLETIVGPAGKRSNAEPGLTEFLGRCRQADAEARKVVLRCHDDNSAQGEEAELLGRCRANDPAAWDDLITRIEKPLLHEIRTQHLITRYLAGDSNAGVELFRSIEAKIKGLVCFRIYNLTREDVQDLVQESAGKIFRELPTYDSRKASFDTFWRLLVTQVCYDDSEKRQAKKRRPVGGLESIDGHGDGDEPIDLPAQDPGPSDVTSQREEFRLLHRALEKLGSFDVRCRKLFELFYFEENSYAEIAGILNMNAKTVSTGLVRCREKIAECFPNEFREQARRYSESVT